MARARLRRRRAAPSSIVTIGAAAAAIKGAPQESTHPLVESSNTARRASMAAGGFHEPVLSLVSRFAVLLDAWRLRLDSPLALAPDENADASMIGSRVSDGAR